MADLPVLRDQERRVTPRTPTLPRATDEAFGANYGRAGRALAAGLTDVATTAENIDQRLDAADARERDNLFSERERELLYAPETGYFSLQGRNALERRQAIEEELRAYGRELAEGSRSGRARAAFNDLNARRLEQTLDQVERHNAAQMTVYEDTVSEAAMREAHDNAVLQRNDPDQVNAYLNTIDQHAATVARRRGLDGEAALRFAEERTSAARADVIIAMADDDPAMADEVFQRWRGRMTAGDQGRVNEATRAVRMADRARRRWDEIWEEAGGDYRRAYAMVEEETNTVLQAEIYQHADRMRTIRENAEMGDAQNAAERARTAISSGGVNTVRAADRALLVREGMWESVLNEFNSGSQRNNNPTTNFLLRLSVDAPQAFNMVMSVMREQPLPIDPATGQRMSEETLDAALRRATGMGVEEWRQAGQAMPTDDYVALAGSHDYARGLRGTGDEGLTLVQRSYRDVWAVATMRAGQLGVTLGGTDNTARREGLSSFLVARTRDFVRDRNRAPDQDEMLAMVNEAFAQEHRGRWNSWVDSRPAASSRYAFEAGPDTTVTVPYARIPPAARQRLLRQWQADHPDEARDNNAAVSGVEEAYAAELRRY